LWQCVFGNKQPVFYLAFFRCLEDFSRHGIHIRSDDFGPWVFALLFLVFFLVSIVALYLPLKVRIGVGIWVLTILLLLPVCMGFGSFAGYLATQHGTRHRQGGNPNPREQ
jgi:hypothetical protein